jgi:hypothetical protein
MRLPRADNHALHLVDEALDDGAAVLFILTRREVNGQFAAQPQCVAGLATRCPRRFQNGDRALFRQSRFACGQPRATCEGTQGGNHVSSCEARHLRLSGRVLPYPARTF